MKSTTVLPARPAAGQSSWFKSWFDSDFYHQLYANRNEKEAADFIDQLVFQLQPPPGSTMLDLGCGSGRHAKYLASKGFRVTGMDLAFSSIRSAKKFETFDLRFCQQDMRLPFGSNQFNYVFNFFTSFGYFNTDAENHKVMRNIYDALTPRGLLVMDYMNAAWSEKRLLASEEKEIDGIVYKLNRWTDTTHFYKKIVIDGIQAKDKFEYTEQVARFSLAEFEKMFSRNGLQLQQVYGDYQLNNYDSETSPRLIMIVKK